MWPLVVEDLDEVIEACLLLQEVASRWFASLFFQGEMHAFVTAILLRMARLDALDADAETQPPDGELAQVEPSMRRGKRHTVVTAKVAGRPRSEKAFQIQQKRNPLWWRKAPTSEQKTAGVIGDRQRVAVLTVPRQATSQ